MTVTPCHTFLSAHSYENRPWHKHTYRLIVIVFYRKQLKHIHFLWLSDKWFYIAFLFSHFDYLIDYMFELWYHNRWIYKQMTHKKYTQFVESNTFQMNNVTIISILLLVSTPFSHEQKTTKAILSKKIRFVNRTPLKWCILSTTSSVLHESDMADSVQFFYCHCRTIILNQVNVIVQSFMQRMHSLSININMRFWVFAVWIHLFG